MADSDDEILRAWLALAVLLIVALVVVAGVMATLMKVWIF